MVAEENPVGLTTSFFAIDFYRFKKIVFILWSSRDCLGKFLLSNLKEDFLNKKPLKFLKKMFKKPCLNEVDTEKIADLMWLMPC